LFGSNNSLGNFLIKNETADALRLSVANNGDISFYEDTGTTAKLFWDASAESLGIGTTSPSAELDVVGATAGSGSAETVFRLSQPANTLGANNEIRSGVTSGTSPYLSFAVRQSASPYATVERMRIDSSGNLLVAQTALNYNAVGSSLASNGTLRSCVDGGLVAAFNRKTSDGAIVNFYKNGTTVGSISTNANSLPSDRNFKTNIQDLSLGLNFISSLEPVTYNYKIDEDGAPVMAGLIAQDVEIALAAAGVEANSMTLLQHNPTEDEKESDYQMDYLKLVPVLINAVKELTERLEQLENN
jgi:hypothetical protein